jgi:hypothetical protein
MSRCGLLWHRWQNKVKRIHGGLSETVLCGEKVSWSGRIGAKQNGRGRVRCDKRVTISELLVICRVVCRSRRHFDSESGPFGANPKLMIWSLLELFQGQLRQK